jgi:hypothetical protein
MNPKDANKMAPGGHNPLNTAEAIDGSTATPAELRRAGIEAPLKALRV